MIQRKTRLTPFWPQFQEFFPLALLILATLLASPAVAPAKDLDADLQLSGRRLRAAFQPVVAAARKSTVEVWCQNKHVAMGVVIDSEGHILTKASELQANPTCRFYDDSEIRSKLLAADREYDLALLHVDKDELHPIQWAETDMQEMGRWVITPGLEASPVAVGVSSVKSLDIPKIRGKAWLGIEMDVAVEQAKIQSIRPFSSASRSGLRSGDIILQVSDIVVENRDKMFNALKGYSPGDSLFVRVLRGQEYLNFQVTLGRSNEDHFHRQAIQNRMGAKLSTRRAGFQGIMQHDTVMSSHDCGGPLLNLDGDAIGLNIARGGRTESYAVPVSILRQRIEELQSGRLAVKLPDHVLPDVPNVELVSRETEVVETILPEPPPLPEN
ncbi:MAG: PDZ domain-containing protein [Planctomycetaceae bacterium]|nr:PDZ domain-containing protein [Planctomycetaceae bacterium]